MVCGILSPRKKWKRMRLRGTVAESVVREYHVELTPVWSRSVGAYSVVSV